MKKLGYRDPLVSRNTWNEWLKVKEEKERKIEEIVKRSYNE